MAHDHSSLSSTMIYLGNFGNGKTKQIILLFSQFLKNGTNVAHCANSNKNMHNPPKNSIFPESHKRTLPSTIPRCRYRLLYVVSLITGLYQVNEMKFNEIPVSVCSLNINLFCFVYYNARYKAGFTVSAAL